MNDKLNRQLSYYANEFPTAFKEVVIEAAFRVCQKYDLQFNPETGEFGKDIGEGVVPLAQESFDQMLDDEMAILLPNYKYWLG